MQRLDDDSLGTAHLIVVPECRASRLPARTASRACVITDSMPRSRAGHTLSQLVIAMARQSFAASASFMTESGHASIKRHQTGQRRDECREKVSAYQRRPLPTLRSE